MEMSLSEELLHTTIRIESRTPRGICTGTGFFFSFCVKEDASIPAIVTNKHVVKDAIEGNLVFSLADGNGNLTGEVQSVPIQNFRQSWIFHPDDDVDLCVCPFAPLHQLFDNHERRLFYKSLNADNLPKSKDVDALSCIDRITMIGYPNGLWDEANNLPIVRSGITATPFRYDYLGKKEFMIDSACFPGSSGSPVFIYDQGSYSQGNDLFVGTRLFLLGIMYAGPLATVDGKIVMSNTPHVESNIMMNLGMVIKSERLLEFEPLLRGILDTSSD
ncbi:trypsin-like peptidase domain-containing protein [Eggerthella sp. NSJ-70]|uniref:Trypsin-like peptidase domain-containing protein n=1 Tax=Eggerthella hominis TaxID=2763043 RepID=A0ABR7BQ22_9ACTN|nr:serine protease [Eggerthella hominis]MBC5583719.1 trypsin-like peptidase domain-containing protein [Eggerthella hominis]